VQFYLTLLDNYVPDPDEACWGVCGSGEYSVDLEEGRLLYEVDGLHSELDQLETRDHRRQFLLNLICFAACIEGLFFFAAFAYVYFLRSKGLLHGLASGTNWVFRDESCHLSCL